VDGQALPVTSIQDSLSSTILADTLTMNAADGTRRLRWEYRFPSWPAAAAVSTVYAVRFAARQHRYVLEEFNSEGPPLASPLTVRSDEIEVTRAARQFTYLRVAP